jgi:mannobiose 2-epimerase
MKFRRCAAAAAAGVLFVISFGCAQHPPGDAPHSVRLLTDRDSIAQEMETTLDAEFARWYPASIDRDYGGYLSDFNYAWEADGRQNKFIVTQARHVWSASNAAPFFKGKYALRDAAAHGVEYLQHTMWDAQHGGFYDLVDRRGTPIGENGRLIKTAYGNTFAIYGLAAYVELTGDTSALRLAKDGFRWLEKHSYDTQYGGYFQFMTLEGDPFVEGYRGVPPKDYNSLIHILEGYTQLYRVWKDPLVHDRLFSLLHIIRDTVTTDKGYLGLYFMRDWTPAGGSTASELNHISFGHDVETAYLMLEASEVLGIKNDTLTLRIAKKMVDHALENGWDAGHGGIYDEGWYESGSSHAAITRTSKEWWAQVEAFNAFLMMSDLFPNDDHGYYERFCTQWKYCMTYLIDHERGGWYWAGTDMAPDNVHSVKGSIWKGNYHTSRGLINCIARLRRTASGK